MGSGGLGTYIYNVVLPSYGDFDFTYDPLTNEDRFRVVWDSNELLDTGIVSGGATVTLSKANVSPAIVTVYVYSASVAADWGFTINCAAPPP